MDKLYGQIATALKEFTPENKLSVLDYTNTDMTQSISYRALLAKPDALSEVLVRLPEKGKEKLKIEQAIVYQFILAKQNRDASQSFWQNLLKAYTNRDEEVILKRKGLFTLAGLDTVKSRLMNNVVMPHLSGETKAPSFALFVGPPGGGKTVCAKKLAEEMGYGFLAPSYGDLSATQSGDGPTYGLVAERLALAFQKAKEKGPCVLFLDEMTAIARNRVGSSSGNDVSVTTDSLLQELNKIKEFNQNLANQDKKVLVVGAINNLSELDPAIKSRALEVKFDTPDETQLKAIAKMKLKECFTEYQIKKGSYELIQPISDLMAAATSDPRAIESMASAIARSAAYDYQGMVTMDIAKQQIHEEVTGISRENTTVANEINTWQTLVNDLLGPVPAAEIPLPEVPESGWLSRDERAEMDRLLPDSAQFKQASIVDKTLFQKGCSFVLQNKREFALVTMVILAPLGIAGLSFLVSHGVIGVGLYGIGKALIMGVSSALQLSALNPVNSYATSLNAQLDGLKSLVETKLSVPSETVTASSKVSAIKFGASNKLPQDAENLDAQVSPVHPRQSAATMLNNLKDLTNLLASKLEQPKALLNLANKILSNLEELMGTGENTRAFRDEVKEVRVWLNKFHEFKTALPSDAQTFGELDDTLRLQYRELLYRALKSSNKQLQHWGNQEAHRVGYSKTQIQQLQASNE